jgi:hypothetical protein
MSTIHLHETTTATPVQFVAGLTDFGPGRSKLFGRSADDYLEVHDQGRMLGILLGIVGKRVLGKELGKTSMAIEARNERARAAGLASPPTAS